MAPSACPVCETPAAVFRQEAAHDLKRDLAKHFNTEEGLEQVEIDTYSLNRCPNCTLEFAHPMKPGSPSFYEWVTRQPNYYPPDRWEYSQFDGHVESVIARNGKFRVLDVGCGSGKFLKRLKAKFGTAIDCVGIDITPGALSQAGDCGIQFILGDHREVDPSSLPLFDLVTSFHCLEHVEDPYGFVGGMVRYARRDGKVAVSTPLSPMSFEFEWDAVMNRPPHHMSRWNERAYAALAERLGMAAEFASEMPAGPFGRAANSVVKSLAGYDTRLGKARRYLLMLSHPLRTLRHLRYQFGRPVLNGKPRGEDILVIFRQVESQ